MSAKHRKASKLAAKRAAVAATAVGATAAIGMMGVAPAQAAAPDYAAAIGDYSHALDNFLKAANAGSNSLGSVWNPIAGGSGGALPVFGSSVESVDGTKLTNIPAVIRNLAGISLPGTVPGTSPEITIAGQTINLQLPTGIPGADAVVDVADLLDGLIGPGAIFNPIADRLPPISDLIYGLEASQTLFNSGYDWGLAGINGHTKILNTFVQTPDGIVTKPITLPPILGIPGTAITIPSTPLIPPGTLPSGTIWAPQGEGNYNFPLGGQVGWWGAMPTGDLKIPLSIVKTFDPSATKDLETVVSIPIYAAGAKLPLDLLTVGTLGANVMTFTDNGVYSMIGLNMTNVQAPLGFGLINLNANTGNYAGTNGFYYDNGQNLVLLNNPLFPIPLIYGLGGMNFGVEGAGIQSPSLFGIKLFSDLQLGEEVGPTSSAGLLPIQMLPPNPMDTVITAITGTLGISSVTQILGLDQLVIDPVTGLLTPLYLGFSGAALKPLSDFATSQYGPFVNGSASQILDLSKSLVDVTSKLPGADEAQPVPPPPAAQTTAPVTPLMATAAPVTGGDGGASNPTAKQPQDDSQKQDITPTDTSKHTLGTPGSESFQDLRDRLKEGNEQFKSDLKESNQQFKDNLKDLFDGNKDKGAGGDAGAGGNGGAGDTGSGGGAGDTGSGSGAGDTGSGSGAGDAGSGGGAGDTGSGAAA